MLVKLSLVNNGLERRTMQWNVQQFEIDRYDIIFFDDKCVGYIDLEGQYHIFKCEGNTLKVTS